jgi:hypothetical protein
LGGGGVIPARGVAGDPPYPLLAALARAARGRLQPLLQPVAPLPALACHAVDMKSTTGPRAWVKQGCRQAAALSPTVGPLSTRPTFPTDPWPTSPSGTCPACAWPSVRTDEGKVHGVDCGRVYGVVLVDWSCVFFHGRSWFGLGRRLALSGYASHRLGVPTRFARVEPSALLPHRRLRGIGL